MPHSSPPPNTPSLATRVIVGSIFAIIGGVVGYGFISAGPGPALSVFEFPGAAWVFGGSAVCGLLAAAWPNGVLRRRWESKLDRDV
jgi:hypothetical protein